MLNVLRFGISVWIVGVFACRCQFSLRRKAPYSKRWRACPASSNFANHLGLRRLPAEPKPWRRLELRGDGAFAWHERLRIASRLSPNAGSRCACPRTPRRARTSPAPSNIAKRPDCGAFTAAFPRSAAVLKTSRSISAHRSRFKFSKPFPPFPRCDWSCGHSRAPAESAGMGERPHRKRAVRCYLTA